MAARVALTWAVVFGFLAPAILAWLPVQTAAAAPTWSVTLDVSAREVSVGTTVTLTARSNMDVGPTDFYIYIVKSDGTELEVCGDGKTCSTDVSLDSAGSRTYQAVVGEESDSGIVARSSEVRITWKSSGSTSSSSQVDPAVLADLHSHFSDQQVSDIVLLARYMFDAPRCYISLANSFIDATACGPAAADIAQITGLWLNPREVGQPQPAKPRNLRARATGPNSIQLAWDDRSDNESGFNIYDGKVWVGKTNADQTSYTVRGLAAGSYHCYQVSAFNGSEESDRTDWACDTTSTR